MIESFVRFIDRYRLPLIIGVIAVCLASLHQLRLMTQSFGISLGYLYMLVIAVGALGFGFRGGMAVAAVSSLIFLGEVHAYTDMQYQELVRQGTFLRVISYLFLGGVIGYYVDTVDKQRRELKTDVMTGIENYRGFYAHLCLMTRYAVRYKEKFALVLIDIDNFKVVNDTYGHFIGNEVLRKFAGILKESIRDIDMVARYGGDEFLILLKKQDTEVTHEIVRRILEKVKLIEVRNRAKRTMFIPITFSAGIAYFPENTKAAESLLLAADDALYWAKRMGRNQVFESWGELMERENEYAGAERRTCLRFSLSREVAKGFRIRSGSRPEFARSFVVCDISRKGALIEGRYRLMTGEAFDIIFSTHDGTEKVLKAVALSDSRYTTEGLYLTNVHFLDEKKGSA